MFRIYFHRLRAYERARRVPLFGRLARRGLVVLEQLPVDEFHGALSVPPFTDLQGTRKDTVEGRFRDLDRRAVQVLREQIGDRSPLRVHDIGVSSGNTSLEMRQALAEGGIDARLTVSDRFCRLWVDDGLVGSVHDPTERFVEGWFGPVAADPADRLATAPLTVMLGKLLGVIRRRRRSHSREVLLFVPELRRLIDAGEVAHVDYDVLHPALEGCFDYVRCMNVLNRVYFDDDALRVGIVGLGRMLADGGVLQLGRTEMRTGRQLVSFFRRQGDRLELIDTVEGGSDIAELVPRDLEARARAS